MRLLIEHGALVDLPNVQGVTPLIVAAGLSGGRSGVFANTFGGESRAIEIIDILLAAGADINARIVDNYDLTATVGRTPNALTEREGHTPLLAAVGRGWERAVEHLIANGAQVDIVDGRGRTPVEIARAGVAGREASPSEDIAAMLEQHLSSLD